MANSRKPGPAYPAMDWCRAPALTPGPLGLFDQGDPNVTTLLGDTPGPLGMNDWNDPTIGCFHNALASLSSDADDDFVGSGVGGALLPVELPVNRTASSMRASSMAGKAAAASADGSRAAGAVTDFTAVANTRGSYPGQGTTEFQGNDVPYTTSFNPLTGYWEQFTGDGFLINTISWAPRESAPAKPISAMSLSMRLQSESLYTAGRSFLGDAYRVAIHEVLNPNNTWAIRTGYGLSALVVAIPGFLNDLSRDLYNSPSDLYVGGKRMSAGWANRDPYGFSDGLMRFSTGLLSAAGGAGIVEKGIVSNRSPTTYAASNQAARTKYVAEENAARVDASRFPVDGDSPVAPPPQNAPPMAFGSSTTLVDEAKGPGLSSPGRMPDWLKARFDAGNEFNRANRSRYPYNEVEVADTAGNKFRVDSYDPVAGEIVSRKYTQLGEVKPETGIDYLRELDRKYPSGASISDSVFNPRILQGQRLSGDLILEVPVQNGPIPQAVLDYAGQNGMIIRDVNGVVH